MWDFILNRIPWWIQAGVLLTIVGVPTYMISCMLLGTEKTNRYVLGFIIGAAALVGLASKLRQDGYKARMAEEDRATKRAEKVVEDGLNLVPYIIVPHVDNAEFNEVMKVVEARPDQDRIIRLKDSQAVIFDDNDHRIVEAK